MPAYVISDLEIRDAAAFECYRTLAAASIAQHGGRYLVRGGAAEAAEGGPPPKTLIIVEFPSMEAARAFYNSAEYQQAKAIRAPASQAQFVIVQGVE